MVRMTEEWDLAYRMLHGVKDADATRIAVFLLPDAEGLAFITECTAEDPGQPLSKSISELQYIGTFARLVE